MSRNLQVNSLDAGLQVFSFFSVFAKQIKVIASGSSSTYNFQS